MRHNSKLFIRLFGMVRPYRLTFVLSVVAAFSGQLATIGLLGFAAAGAVKAVSGESSALWFLVLAGICAVSRGILRYAEHYTGHDMAFRLLFELRKKIFEAMDRQAPARLLQRDSGDLCSLLMGDVELVETFFAHTLTPIVTAALTAFFVLSVLGALHPAYIAVFIPVYLLTGVLLPVLSYRNTASSGKEYRSRLSRLNADLIEKIQGLKEIMLFNREDKVFHELSGEEKSGDDAYRTLRVGEGRLNILVEFILVASAAALFFVSVALYQSGDLGQNSILIAIVIGLSSFGPFISLMYLSNSLVNTSAAAVRIFDFLDAEPVVENQKSPVREFRVDRSPVAEEINFVYPDTDRIIFDHFSFCPEKGKMTALKGESGRGKSSLLYLLMRFYDPVKGKVILENRDLRVFDLYKLRAGISYFAQDTFLFNISVAENIRMARSDAGDEELREAARLAGADEFIQKLPEAYDTMAGERGRRFSSGERQRIGLARIFLQNNDLILLDEPASNLDRENEELVAASLLKGFEGKTLVMISHRPSLLGKADCLVDV